MAAFAASGCGKVLDSRAVLAPHKRERLNVQSVAPEVSDRGATMLLLVTVAAAVLAVALTERHLFEPSAGVRLKAASRKVDNSAAAVEVALKPLLPV